MGPMTQQAMKNSKKKRNTPIVNNTQPSTENSVLSRVENALGNAFHQTINNTVYPIPAQLFHEYVGRPLLKKLESSSEEKGKEIQNARTNYMNTPKYSSAIDKQRNTRSSGLYNEYISRVGMLGLIPNGDGTYKCYDNKGNIIKNCAQTVNQIQRSLGNHQNTDGNAWDSKGVYGQKYLFDGNIIPKIGGYNKLYHNVSNGIASLLGNIKVSSGNIDLKTGDVVGLFSTNSDHNNEAWYGGTNNRSNSHEGIVFQPEGRKDRTYIIHNINGKVYVDPITEFTGLTPGWGITSIYRPNKKPQNNTNINSNITYNASKNGKDFYDFLTAEGRKKYNINVHDNRDYILVNGKPKVLE